MTTPEGRRTVVIVDDHAMFRTGVRAELADHVEVLGRRPTWTPRWAPCSRSARTWCCSTCTCPAAAGSR